jgi:hypothetical protein
MNQHDRRHNKITELLLGPEVSTYGPPIMAFFLTLGVIAYLIALSQVIILKRRYND